MPKRSKHNRHRKQNPMTTPQIIGKDPQIDAMLNQASAAQHQQAMQHQQIQLMHIKMAFDLYKEHIEKPDTVDMLETKARNALEQTLTFLKVAGLVQPKQ